MNKVILTPPAQGGCQCGAVRYEITGEPVNFYACHCTECRKQSASAFGLSVITRREDFELLQGEIKAWTRPTDSGGMLTCWFCPVCGTRLWHENDGTSETISVKGGSLDSPPDMSQAGHLWTKSALPGVPIPARAWQYSSQPEK